MAKAVKRFPELTMQLLSPTCDYAWTPEARYANQTLAHDVYAWVRYELYGTEVTHPLQDQEVSLSLSLDGCDIGDLP